jgi:choline kinase
MAIFEGVQSLRLRDFASQFPSPDLLSMTTTAQPYGGNGMMDIFKHKLPPHSSHPNFANLTLLVFEAVLEVVCVSAPGYIVARIGMFDAENQKFLANLNTQLFTPCLSMSSCALTIDLPADLLA